MSFLDELQQEKEKDNQKKSDKTTRQLWESCFKYFKHFVSIIQKDKGVFEAEFNFSLLNIKTDCTIIGPYEIKRTQDDNELKLEVTLLTQLTKTIKIKRKDQRSAELLRIKLSKDNIQSTVNSDKENNYFIELNPNIHSAFRIILKEEKSFFVEYKNIGSSSDRSIKLPIEKINQDYMDQLAKYILGKNPTLYTESISNREISKLRDQIALDKEIKAIRDAKLKAIVKEEEKLEEIRKANTLKEKSKRYLIQQSKGLKNKIINKINDLKHR